MSRRVRLFSFVVAVSVIIACGGGAGNQPFLGANYFLPSAVGTVVNQIGATATVEVGGQTALAKLPTGVTAPPGTKVMVILDGAKFADRAFIPSGSPVVRVVNLATSSGGDVTSVGLTQANTVINTSGYLAVPEGRWRLEYNGLVRFFGQATTSGMDVRQLAFEFDVLNDGSTNLPIEIYGDLPKNGKSQNGLAVSGKMMPNAGFGPLYLDFKASAGSTMTFDFVKPPAAQFWTWSSNNAFATPTDGWDSIGVRVTF